MTAVIINAKGTTSPSFRINKNGPTLYQGATPSIVSAPLEGDLFFRVGSSGTVFQFQNGEWRELGKIQTGSTQLQAQNNSAIATDQYVYYGSTTDAEPTKLSIDGLGAELELGTASAGHFKVSAIGSSHDRQQYVVIDIKGTYMNMTGIVDGVVVNQGQVLGVSPQEIFEQTTETLDVGVTVNNSTVSGSLSITVTGLDGVNMSWAAFVQSTSIQGLGLGI